MTVVPRSPIDVWAIVVGGSIESWAPQVEAQSYSRRVDVGVGAVGDRGNDSGRGSQLPLHVCCGGGLPVALLLKLFDGALLSLQLPFQLSNLFPLQFDKGIETAGLRFTFVR